MGSTEIYSIGTAWGLYRDYLPIYPTENPSVQLERTSFLGQATTLSHKAVQATPTSSANCSENVPTGQG